MRDRAAVFSGRYSICTILGTRTSALVEAAAAAGRRATCAQMVTVAMQAGASGLQTAALDFPPGGLPRRAPRDEHTLCVDGLDAARAAVAGGRGAGALVDAMAAGAMGVAGRM